MAFTLIVTCSYAQQTLLLTESFETGSGTIPPTGWAVEQVTGTQPGISFVTGTTSPTITTAYDGVRFIEYNSFSIISGSTRLKRTTAVSTLNKSFVMVDFAWYEDPGYPANADKAEVQWSTDGTTWSTAGTFNRYNAVAGWKVKNAVLPSGADNQATLFIAFLFTSANGNNCAMDLVHVTVGPPPPAAFATIGFGTVSSNYPYTTFWMGGRTQMLYTAAELTASGMSAGNISSIGFNVITNSSQVMNGFSIKIGSTILTNLTAGYVNGLSSCYSSSYAVPGTGWQDITLSTPYAWNGTSNLIIEICYGNTSYTTYSPVYATSLTGMTAGHFGDTQTECTTGINSAPSARPNIRFGIPAYTRGVLMGYVRDASTMIPIPGALVQVGSARDTTGANGSYIFYNLIAGSVNANATAPGYISGSSFGTIIGGFATNLDIFLTPGPRVGGIVTDVSTGLPIVGATVAIGQYYTTMSTAGGNYLTPPMPLTGVQTIVFSKTGYDSFSGIITLTPNITTTQNAALLTIAVQPGPVTASLNGIPGTAVDLTWSSPQGMYQLIYDDGIQDVLSVWDSADNLNAMRFTPLGWPSTLTGGKVNLGTTTNYPSNALPLTKFTILVNRADGTGGLPGTVVDSVEVTPSGFGWVSFTFAAPIIINSGDFYLVMKQGGTPPHAAGIGKDLTSSQLRSYSRSVITGGTWIQEPGNFMIRAIVEGSGGPLSGDNPSTNVDPGTASSKAGIRPETPGDVQRSNTSEVDYQPLIISYQVWRLLQGQENNPAQWTSIWTTSQTTTTDNAWPVLPPGPYRWAVKAIYSLPGQRFSAPTFSNVIGKNWIASVTTCVSLSCAANSKAGTFVKLSNTAYPDSTYTQTTDTSGCVHFTKVWKGNYQLQVMRFTYQASTQTVTVNGDTTINTALTLETAPPRNLTVNVQSLHAAWDFPRYASYQFIEDWASGSFSTNQWAISGGTNWQISPGSGNPSPSAMFNWTPADTNYNQYLTSKLIAGAHAPLMRLQYDIFLSNAQSTNLNTMAVEIWEGTNWSVLKSYDNTYGSFPWTSESFNITFLTNIDAFRIRFHAAGTISNDINNWNIDNIKVINSDGNSGPNPCVVGYNFYLNDTLIGFTPDTTFAIPPNRVVYGQPYTACVRAMFGNIPSAPICVSFVSNFLYPPRNLTATYIPDIATLNWEAPVPSPGLTGYNIYRNSTKINAIPVTDLNYIDNGVPYGLNSYRVTAVYGSNESLPAGPVLINAVPVLRSLTDIVVADGQYKCYNATQTIVVAGNGTTFLVENGGNATMIAGQNIIYNPGTTVQPGGYMWGYIAPSGPFCQHPSMPAAITGQPDPPFLPAGNSTFNIYPNPTNGTFTFEYAGDAEYLAVDIFKMRGECVLRTTLKGEHKHMFSLSAMPAGIYFVRVISDDRTDVVKIIKQ